VSSHRDIRTKKLYILAQIWDLIRGRPFLRIEIHHTLAHIYLSHNSNAPPPSPMSLLPLLSWKNKYISSLRLDDGKVMLHLKRPLLYLDHIRARILHGPPYGIRGEVLASPSFAKSIYLSFDLCKKHLTFSSKIKSLSLPFLTSLYPQVSTWINHARGINTCIRGTLTREKIYIQVLGTSHSISLTHGCNLRKPSLELSIISPLSSFPGHMNLYIKKLTLLSPYLSLGGEILFSPTDIKVNLFAPLIDYSGFLKEYHRLGLRFHIIDTISRIVSAGKISKFRFYLTKEKHAHLIWGLMGKGNNMQIAIPSIGLSLSRVRGDFEVKHNILYCKGASGRVEGSSFYNADLVLGLNSRIRPFDLKVDTSFNLSHLTQLLMKLQVHRSILSSLNKLEITRGKCKGHVHVWKEKDKFYVEVKARDIIVKGKLAKCNIPFKMDTSLFYLNTYKSIIKTDGIKGKIGTSKIQYMSLLLKTNKKLISIKGQLPNLNILETAIVGHHLFSIPLLDPYIKEGKTSLTLNGLTISYGIPEITSINASGEITKIIFKKKLLQALGALSSNDSSIAIPFTQMEITGGGFSLSTHELSLSNIDLHLKQSHLHLSHALLIRKRGSSCISISGEGRVGQDIQSLLRERIPSLKRINLRPLLKIKRFSIKYGDNQHLNLSIWTLTKDSSLLKLELSKDTHGLRGEIHILQGKREGLYIRCIKRKNKLGISFKGVLTRSMVEGVLLKNPWIKGKIKGDFYLTLSLSPFTVNYFKGSLHLSRIRLPRLPLHVELKQGLVVGGGRNLSLRDLYVICEDNLLNARGEVYLMEGRDSFDIRVRAKEVTLDPIIAALRRYSSRKNSHSLVGRLNIHINTLHLYHREFTDINALIRLREKKTSILLKRAYLCSIPLGGGGEISSRGVNFFVSSKGKKMEVQRVLACLLGEKKRVITGEMDLSLRIKAHFPLAQDNSSCNGICGSIRVEMSKGRIYKLTLLSRILAILNSTEIFFGTLPSLDKEGFAYSSLTSEAKIENGLLTIEHSTIIGDTMDIIFHGKVDIKRDKMDMVAFIAPLKTLDRIVKKIPVIRSLLKGHVLLIPVGISGRVEDPKVIPLSPNAVTSEVFQILKNILTLPFTIFQPAK